MRDARSDVDEVAKRQRCEQEDENNTTLYTRALRVGRGRLVVRGGQGAQIIFLTYRAGTGARCKSSELLFITTSTYNGLASVVGFYRGICD